MAPEKMVANKSRAVQVRRGEERGATGAGASDGKFAIENLGGLSQNWCSPVSESAGSEDSTCGSWSSSPRHFGTATTGVTRESVFAGSSASSLTIAATGH